MSKPTLLILGATGSQGSAVLSYYRTHHPKTYNLRGLTRNPSSPKSLALTSRGVEMIKADLSNPTSLQKALAGATFVFASTDFSAGFENPEAQRLVERGEARDLAEACGMLEFEQGKNIAHAAAENEGLERLIWSCGPNAKEISQGGIAGVHEQQWKWKVWEYMLSLEGLKGKVNAVIFAVFADSLIRFPEIMGWSKQGKEYVLRMPVSGDAKLPFIDMPAHGGKWVEVAMRIPAGSVLGAIGGKMSFNEILEKLREKYGVEVKMETISLEEYVGGDETGALKNVGSMFQWFGEFGYEDVPGVLRAKDLAKIGYGVEQGDIRRTMEELDWSPIL